MSATTPPARICPSLDTLDELELVRSGARTLSGSTPLRIGIPPDALGVSPVELVDLEGVPLAQASVDGDDETTLTLREAPTWLGSLSSRPFEHLYTSPEHARERVAAGATAYIVDRPLEPGDLAAQESGAAVLLTLAGPTVDPDSRALATLRSAVATAHTRPDTEVVAIPLSAAHAAADPELLDQVVQAYAGGPAARLSTASAAADTPEGLVVFFTGLSGSGKSTVARAVRNALLERDGIPITMLDGDVVRRNLSAGLGFSPEDRETNIRRIGWVAAQIAHHGGLAICSPIAPYDATRRAVRQMVHDRGGRFVLVHISTPVEECERRDRKGLYAKARSGQIPQFTGISAPYERPEDAELSIDTTTISVEDARDRVLAHLTEKALVPGLAHA